MINMLGGKTMARTRNFNQEKAVQQAMELFWTKGYEATSMADLLKATSLSKSSLYETFGSKKDLFLSAYYHYRVEHLHMLKGFLQNEKAAYQSIIDLFQGLVDDCKRQEFPIGCMICNEAIELAPHDATFQKLIEEDFQNIEELFRKTVQRGQQDGSITCIIEAQNLAHFLTVNLQGLQVMARANSDVKRLEATVAVISKALQL